MKYIYYIVSIVAFFGLMSGLFGSFKIFGAVPNLVLLGVIFFALEDDSFDPFVAALVAGFLLDAASAVSPGTFTLGFVLLVFLIQLMLQQVIYFQFEQRYLIVLVVAAYTFLFGWVWLYNLIGVYFHWSQSGLSALSLWNRFLPTLIYTLILAYPVYWVVDWSRRLINRRAAT